MLSLTRVRLLSILSAVAALSPSLQAQCPAWQAGFEAPGVDYAVNALAVFDDGSGSALYVGGGFFLAGPVHARSVARWNGSTWSAAGAGIAAEVNALAVFDDGSGPALYAGSAPVSVGGGLVSGIHRWNGASWSDVGTAIDGTVYALTVHDDGSGPALFAGGSFSNAGGASASSVAKWNGSGWAALGAGIGGGAVRALAAFDAGSGLRLYAGGTFATAGGASAARIARWDGASWSALGSGTSGNVSALAVYSDGSGTNLYVGGEFTAAGGSSALHVARWSGASWSAVSSGISGYVRSFTTFDDGSGAALYAGTRATGEVNPAVVVRWNGTSWTTDPTPFAYIPFGYPEVRAFAAYDSGAGPKLYAGGDFDRAQDRGANNIAVYENPGWNVVGTGAGIGPVNFGAAVLATQVFDDGTGPALYVGGQFQTAGDAVVSSIARWNGSSWSAVGGGIPTTVMAMTVYDDGTGAALYAAGRFLSAGGVQAMNIAKWDGVHWSPLGAGLGFSLSSVFALCVFDDGHGPALYAGGNFGQSGAVPAACIARWDGSTWTGIDSGLYPPDNFVSALAVFDDGSGPALFVGGGFPGDGSHGLRFLARWDGSTWSSPGGGVNNVVSALAAFDDGSGLALYAGGTFTLAGATPANHVARWNGSTWSAAGAGQTLPVACLCAFDDGGGPALYAGGKGYTAHVERWDGSAWSMVGTGMFGTGDTEIVSAMAAFSAGAGQPADLYAIGNFYGLGNPNTGMPSFRIARWKGCGNVGQVVCLGDGTGAACPCANYGLPGHGCRNSATIRGAELAASGAASLAFDSLGLACEFEPHNVSSVFLQGNQLIAPVVFGDGLRCAGGALKRLYVLSADASGKVSAPAAGALPISQRSAQLGDPIAAGSGRVYQVYYRDPNLSYCPEPLGSSFNVSNGVKLLWTP